MSLVVPAISVTIAFSLPNNVFNKLLFPTFGLPTIATSIPFFIILELTDSFNNVFNFFNTLFIFGFIVVFVNSSISSYSG